MAFDFTISTQPVSLTAVPGQDSTFTVVASSNEPDVTSYLYQWQLSGASITNISGATAASYTIDPLMTDDGKVFQVSVSALSSDVFQSALSSNTAMLTVREDVAPFDTYDVGSETGRQRHLRLRLLGYI